MGRKPTVYPPLTHAQQQRVEEHYDVARRVAKSFFARFPHALPFEDILQVAAHALCLAAIHYDPARQKCFGIFGRICCESRVILALRKEQKQRRAIPFCVAERDGEPLDCEDRRRHRSVEAADLLERVRDVVSAEDFDLLARRYLEGERVKDLAAGRGHYPCNTGQRIRQAIRRVREALPQHRARLVV